MRNLPTWDIWLGSNLVDTICAEDKEQAKDIYYENITHNANIYQKNLAEVVIEEIRIERG